MNKKIRCAIYTRKSTEEGLDQEFNSLDAQREACENYIASQKHEGWECSPELYDDGGFTGGNTERPGLKRLLKDIEAGKIDCIVVYKVDRLSRSLLDFSRIIETFDKHDASFVSVTQAFNTSSSMGRLTLNVLLSFAQFEREVISERTRDKMAATRRKGKWTGGTPVLGYDIDTESKRLVVNETEADTVRLIFALYLEHHSLLKTLRAMDKEDLVTKSWVTKGGKARGGKPFSRNNLHGLLKNVIYTGKITYKDEIHQGEHLAIIDQETFDKVQRLLARNKVSGSTHSRNRYGALLRGLLYCKHCDCAMTHTYSIRKGNCCYRYYVCAKAQQRGWDHCPSPSLPAQEVESFVIDRIKSIGNDPTLRNRVIEKVSGVTREGAEELDSIIVEFTNLWEALSPQEQVRVIQLLIKRIDYDCAQEGLSLTLHETGLEHLLTRRAIA